MSPNYLYCAIGAIKGEMVQYLERESKTLEFKSTLPQFFSLVKTCVAFANGVEGKIIVGIDDKTHKVIGVNDEIRDRLYDEFPSSLYDMTSPGLLAEIYEQCLDGKNIMIIDIPNSIKKEGIPNGIYLRAGSSTHRATSEHVEELMRDYKLFGAKLKGKTVIPEDALREAIINALIHRKYWIPGSVKIALYDDRLEIFSPGNFPGLMNIHHLGDGITHLRNPHLARMARRLGLVEKLERLN
jgi:predicted HTH transcriptional regulator